MSELLAFILQHQHFRQARLPSLYSDFRYLKTTNPNGFHANVTAWKTVLAEACKEGKVGDGCDKLVLSTGEGLVSAVQTRDWGRPLALGVVVAEAVCSKDLYPLDQFLSLQTSIYYWSYAGAALNWGLEMIGVKSPPSVGNWGVVNGQFVVVRNVEDMAKDITRTVSTRNSSLTDRIFTSDLFASEFAPTLSTIDLKVLLRYLSRDTRACAFDGETVKFRSASEHLELITEQDTTIAHLKALVKSLHSRVGTLSADITNCTERAQAAIANQNRTVALAALKSRKTVENTLTHQAKALGQVEDVMASIQTAANNIELIQVLEKSSKVLGRLNKEVGGVDRVDRILEGLREETETVEEVNRMLGEGGAVVDEEAVEGELDAMMKEIEDAARNEKVKEKLENIPKIDTTDRQLSDSLKSMKLGEEGEKDKERETVHA